MYSELRRHAQERVDEEYLESAEKQEMIQNVMEYPFSFLSLFYLFIDGLKNHILQLYLLTHKCFRCVIEHSYRFI